jgi:ABC-2 type transport system permease protein
MTLSPMQSTGWAAGFDNLLGKELGSWWRTRRWLVHLVLWPVIINGIPLMIWLEGGKERTAISGLSESLEVFFQVGAFFALIGAVLVTQGSMVGERKIGTAAWAIALAIQFALTWKAGPNPAHFAEAVGIVAVHQTFYIAMALMLGTLFRSRGPVSGIPLGFWIAGNILPGHLPKWVPMVLPWPTIGGAAKIAEWAPYPVPLWIPVLATAGWTILFLVVALSRFEREEF